MSTRAEFLEAALKDAAAKLDHENHPVATKLFAAMARSKGIPDHSADAGKMVELQKVNRELVEALESSVAFTEQWVGANTGSMLADARDAMLAKARAILDKHKGAA